MTDNATPFQAVAPTGPAMSLLLFGEFLADCFPDREVVGGAPFNVARHLRGLGGPAGLDPVLVTRIGKDERGGRLLEALRAAGLAMAGVQRDLLRPSGQVQVALNGDGSAHGFDIPPDQAWDFIHTDMARLIGLSRRPRWIYFGTLAQRAGSRPALRALLQTPRARGFLDINLRDPWVFKDVLRWSLGKAEIVKMNGEELGRVADLMGLAGGGPDVVGERLMGMFGMRQLLVTEGARGAWLLDAEKGHFQTRAHGPAIEVVDSVGAGDAFAAVYLLGLAWGWPARETLERAHRFAGAVCRLRGAVPDNGRESDLFYRPFLAEWRLAVEETT